MHLLQFHVFVRVPVIFDPVLRLPGAVGSAEILCRVCLLVCYLNHLLRFDTNKLVIDLDECPEVLVHIVDHLSPGIVPYRTRADQHRPKQRATTCGCWETDAFFGELAIHFVCNLQITQLALHPLSYHRALFFLTFPIRTHTFSYYFRISPYSYRFSQLWRRIAKPFLYIPCTFELAPVPLPRSKVCSPTACLRLRMYLQLLYPRPKNKPRVNS